VREQAARIARKGNVVVVNVSTPQEARALAMTSSSL
jgi:hypothetical protein